MKSRRKKDISLTAIFVEDFKSKAFIAFFAQFPNIVAEGTNENEVEAKLLDLVQAVFEKETKEEVKKTKKIKYGSVKTKSFDLVPRTMEQEHKK